MNSITLYMDACIRRSFNSSVSLKCAGRGLLAKRLTAVSVSFSPGLLSPIPISFELPIFKKKKIQLLNSNKLFLFCIIFTLIQTKT